MGYPGYCLEKRLRVEWVGRVVVVLLRGTLGSALGACHGGTY